ncbi:NACHT domain-containing protein [Mycena sanguinolenta]|uniref:NACHT domain-containing protein n=1 Tax=Mycena sanguinolenta TaxID=230812 RepID=A0A8H6Z907_9AGAR|nr:NACHT domain-containing protein [Mycena sanguinolenta]KAF7372847.1 NACHT domain-containing protein [Mycena sanguinolenta]
MPADRRGSKAPQPSASGRWTIVNYISGGRGGPGGSGHGNGRGGAGGHAMSPALNFDSSAGSFIMHNVQQDSEACRIEILHRAVALEAIYDSAESLPQPKCHPETRTKMLEDLREWALESHPETTILWLFGPAGAGKSAIMQTLAGQPQDAGRLGGSFFFKRGHATRGNAKTLFATIAYQLALGVPWLQTSISETVEDDPSVVARSIATQIRKLISEPCRPHHFRDSVAILIDGLDECEGHDVQEEILRAIKHSYEHPISLRFIVASRPEAHICEVFDLPLYLDIRRFNVEQSFEDVRKYLRDEFARIHREHRIMASVPSPWPRPDILQKLVQKSSGHFIYATTIIKFIDDKTYRPTQRLVIVQDENSAGSSSAFDALDRLYLSILGSASRQAEVNPILCAIVNFDLTLDKVEQLFELEDGEAKLLLRWLAFLAEVGRSTSLLKTWIIGWLWLGASSSILQVEIGMDLIHLNPEVQSTYNLCRTTLYLTYPASPPLGNLIPFLIALPPSAELCPLVARMDLDWIFRQRSVDFESMLSWLKRIPSVPQELINQWEDYVFMSLMEDTARCSVKHVLSPSPELCQVLVATVFINVAIWHIRELLDITWTEFRKDQCLLGSRSSQKFGRILEF